MLKIDWSDFKDEMDNRGFYCQYIDINGHYHLQLNDGSFILECTVKKTTADATDFENNYKTDCNKSVTDRSGRMLTRYAAAKQGWSYFAHFFELETGLIGGFYSKDHTGTDTSSYSLKFFDVSDVEVSQMSQATVDANAVETRITLRPTHDYELIAGNLHVITTPATDVRVWTLVGVINATTDVPISVTEFVGGINLKYIDKAKTIQTDGRASKYVTKDIGIGTDANQIQFKVKHNTGVRQKILFSVEYFRA